MTITFPPWVEGPRAQTDKGSVESRRLKYLVMLAAISSTHEGSIAALADACGIERPQVHESIRAGKFSPSMAAKIERKCGRSVVRREWLIYPSEVHALV